MHKKKALTGAAIPHKFLKYEIAVTPELITLLAQRYIAQRAGIEFDASDLDNDPRFKNMGFSSEMLKKIIQQHAVPNRVVGGKQGVIQDIYRSDLGELLMTYFFEERNSQYGEQVYIIPIKNIFDRELSDKAGRGLDAIGYRLDTSKVILLLGEAKVSEEKNSPPQVVHGTQDSIYKTHCKSKKEKDYLLSRLSNYMKKLRGAHALYMSIAVCAIEAEEENAYDIVFGCCLVRDASCVGADDFGKLKSDSATFEPAEVHFIIPCFDKPIAEVVNLFHSEVQRLTA